MMRSTPIDPPSKDKEDSISQDFKSNDSKNTEHSQDTGEEPDQEVDKEHEGGDKTMTSGPVRRVNRPVLRVSKCFLQATFVLYCLGLTLHLLGVWVFTLSGIYGRLSCSETGDGCSIFFVVTQVLILVGLASAILGLCLQIRLKFGYYEGLLTKPRLAYFTAAACLVGAIFNLVGIIFVILDADDILMNWLGRCFIMSIVGAGFELYSAVWILHIALLAVPKYRRKRDKINDKLSRCCIKICPKRCHKCCLKCCKCCKNKKELPKDGVDKEVVEESEGVTYNPSPITRSSLDVGKKATKSESKQSNMTRGSVVSQNKRNQVESQPSTHSHITWKPSAHSLAH